MRNKRKYRNKYKNQYNYNPKSNDQKKIWLAITLTTMVIVTIATVIMTTYTLKSSSEASLSTEPTTVTPTTVAVTTTGETDITSPTQEPTETTLVIEEQPEDLTNLLASAGKNYSDLNQSGCKQLVTVDSVYTNATIRLWECSDDKWTESEAFFCYGYVGSMGTVDNMSEDISGTPRGLYPIGEAFYRYSEPDTKLDAFQITDDTYWIDDPDSKYYNQRVEGTEDKDWDSAEHMADYSVYNYGFVVNYNMPALYNAGSAIFFHIGSGPTAGCIATDEIMVKSYLSELNKNLNPCILIN